MKKWLCVLLTMVTVTALAMPVSATERPIEETTETEESTETESDSEEAVTETKPFLALGADLTEEQKAVVLSELGIAGEDLSQYNVIYITNDMEHEYLDDKIDSSLIGTRSLSSVLVKEQPAGSGLRVTTKNINYCTISMYKNALITSGVEDAEIIIAAPTSISGTAALIGAMKAYENMSGESLSAEAQDVAMEELVVLGELINGVEDSELMAEFLDYIKAEVIAKGITDEESISTVIDAAQEQFGITLSEENKDKIIELMGKIGELDIDPGKLLEQAGDLYDKYGETVLAEAKELMDEVFTEEVKQSIWTAIKDFFSNLWKVIWGRITGSNE